MNETFSFSTRSTYFIGYHLHQINQATASVGASMDQTPHVALYPSPGMGHLIPLVELAKQLAHHHSFSATIIVPTTGQPTKSQKAVLNALPNAINHLFLPPVDLPENINPEVQIFLILSLSLSSLRDALKSLLATTRLVALVVDPFSIDAFDVAKKLHVSPYLFFTSSAMCLSFSFYLPKLDEEVSCEFRDLPEPVEIPGSVPVHGRDLLDPVQDRSGEPYKKILHNVKLFNLAKGVIVNSFMELEGGAIRALQGEEPDRPPVYVIGPLIGSSNEPERSECLQWLDSQPGGSVLFVSFGSGGTLSYEQINELTLGLEMSGQRFIWVIRSPNDVSANGAFFDAQSQNDPLSFLPKGYLDRTKGQGLVVPSWAPQIQVLSHRSTGGFLTHCGWNSTLESVVHGVPMIVWPLYAEQKMNAVIEELDSSCLPTKQAPQKLCSAAMAIGTLSVAPPTVAAAFGLYLFDKRHSNTKENGGALRASIVNLVAEVKEEYCEATASVGASMDQTPHVALYPSPGMGHLIPLVELAKQLAHHHSFSATIIVPTTGQPTNSQKAVLNALPNAINHLFLPPVDLPENINPEVQIFLILSLSLSSLRDALESLLATTRLVALVVDPFSIDAFDVAKMLHVSPYLFFTSSAMCLSFSFYLPKLDEEVSCEFRDLPEPVEIPGSVPVHGRDLLDPVQDRSGEPYKKILHNPSNLPTTTASMSPSSSGPPPESQKAVLAALPSNINHLFLPPVHFPPDMNPEVQLFLTISRCLSSIRDALKSLLATTGFAALIVDAFGIDAFDVARELGVPPYLFFTAGATTLSFCFYLPKLDEMVSCEYRDLPEPVQIPGCFPIHGRDLLAPVQDRSGEAYKKVLYNVKRFRLAEGVLVNSFMELEEGAIKALQEEEPGKPPVYVIGPLIGSSKEPERSECLRWLDKQPDGSVLFVSFGSGGTLSYDQINELALGLEMSGQRFLWVVRSPNDKFANGAFFDPQSQNDPLGFLPKGFLDRTKGQGLVVPSWAPQIEVLGHRSTGGFLTHCGWNSTLETVVHGVPMIVWPLFAEQRMNAIMLTEWLNVALRPNANESGLVERKEIEKVVKDLMKGEEGNRIRNNLKELQDAAVRALGKEGSSTKSLSKLAIQLKNQNIK
ncbi:hypothetical protein RJ640_028313 [Escallonia rubra]|uniref:Hydroquinone glucosyltransferase n=1 Tax=Escallonia rubra TaxID=112253 RepID=A0AA88SP98_9ASTE|nr:hypothetical protein RJ640_028313 [Escallonia rubra]